MYLFLFAILAVILFFVSIVVGQKEIPLQKIWDSFFHYNGSNEHLIIQTSRLPRAILGVLIGSSLAVAGALMQAFTRNPLASPTTLGVNAGASFFIVLALFLFPNIGFFPLTLISFIGATITSLLVLILGSLRQDGMQVVTVTLAGASLTALFSSLTNGLLVANEQGLEDIIFWLTGSIDGRNLEMIRFSLPFFVAGWILSLLISKQLNILQMGDQVAIGLGQRVNQIKWICGIIVVILAGVSVAVAGPIVFVGLIVPHFVRKLVGHDYRFVIPFCFVCGAILLLSADILARFVMREQEIPVGVMTALIGAPIYLMLVRRKREVL